jgi:cyclopropane fatty-acyl-phospholipid synthase-like methyltransferase
VAEPQAATSNAAQIEFWNSAASRAWAHQYDRMDRAVAALTRELLDLSTPQPGEGVLDIGCGAGTTVLELASRVGAGGHVLGADVSEPSVARAQQRIAAAGLRHAVLSSPTSLSILSHPTASIWRSRALESCSSAIRRPPSQMYGAR